MCVCHVEAIKTYLLTYLSTCFEAKYQPMVVVIQTFFKKLDIVSGSEKNRGGKTGHLSFGPLSVTVGLSIVKP